MCARPPRKTLTVVAFLLCLAALGFLMCSSSNATPPNEKQPALFQLHADNKLSAHLDDRPLNEVLLQLATITELDIRGAAVGNEPVSMSLSGLTLEETLARILRGYNYVVVRGEKPNKTLVMMFGKTEHSKYTEIVSPARSSNPEPAPQQVGVAAPTSPASSPAPIRPP